MPRLLRCLSFLLLATFFALPVLGCNNMIDPQRQKEKGMYDKVLERYNTAPGIKSILGEPKWPGLKKQGSIKLEILDNSNEEALKEALGKVTEWYAEANSRSDAGLDKLFVYAVDKNNEAVWVGVYEAGSISGQDLMVEKPNEKNMPDASEKA